MQSLRLLFCTLLVLTANINSYSQSCSTFRYKAQYFLASGSIEIVDNISGTDDNNLLIGKIHEGTDAEYVAVIKLKNDGNVEWAKKCQYNIGLLIKNVKAKLLRDGSFIVTITYCPSNAMGNSELMLIKLSANGNLLWNYMYTVPQLDASQYVKSIEEAIDGKLFLAVNNGYYSAIYCIDKDGHLIWDKSFLQYTPRDSEEFEGSSEIAGVHIQKDSLVALGSIVDAGANTSIYYWAMKLDAATGVLGQLNSYKNYFLDSEPPIQGYIGLGTNLNAVSSSFDSGGFSISGWRGFFPSLYRSYNLTFDNNLLLRSGVVISSGVKAYYTDGKGVLYVSVGLENGKRAQMAFVNSEHNQIVAEKIFMPLSTLDTIRYLPVMARKNKETTNFAFSCSNPIFGQSMFEVIQCSEYDTDDSTECGNKDTLGASLLTFIPPKADLNWSNIISNQVKQNALMLSFTDLPLSVKMICEKKSICDKLTIIGTDTVCNFSKDAGAGFTEQAEYKAVLNGDCYKKVSWSYIVDSGRVSTAPANVMLTTLNDSMVSLKVGDIFNEHTIRLYAHVNDCDACIDSIDIHVFPIPIPNVKYLTLCPNDSVKLTPGSWFKNYRWQNGSTDSVLYAKAAGSYEVTFNNFCSSELLSKIYEISEPEVQPFFSVKNEIRCNTDTIFIQANSAYTYKWLTGYNYLPVTNAVIKVFPVVDTAYVASAEIFPACVIKDSVYIKVLSSPSILYANDTSICKGDSIILKAVDGFESYVWNDGTTEQQKTVYQKGIYSIAGTFTNSCISRDTFVLKNVFELPDISLPHSNILCKNQTTTIDAGKNFSTYLWQDSSKNRFYTINAIGKYYVNVTNTNGCVNSDTILVTAITDTPHSFIVADTMKSCDEILLKPYVNYLSYLWSTGSLEKEITIDKIGKYFLQVTDNNGCTGKELITVHDEPCLTRVIFPNAFSPNNDGNNDIFKPFVKGYLVNYRLKIFDRWGNEIFSSEDYKKGWNGSSKNGKFLAGNSFVWVCNYQFLNETAKNQKGIVIIYK